MTSPAMPQSVGIIGVGNMGGGMAKRLLSQGWAVHVCDIDAHKTKALQTLGATVHDTPHALAQQVHTLIVCVVNAQDVQDVLSGTTDVSHGLLSALQAHHTVMLCPTLSHEDVENTAAQLMAHQVPTIDAPMSGGPLRAEQGTMSLMVACEDAVFAAQENLLNTLSNQVFRISQRVGDGARTKLVNNLLAGINLVGAAEVMALAERLGLSLPTTLSVIAQSSGQSWIGSDRMQRALQNDWAPRAHMSLLTKDTALAQQAAHSVGFQGVLGQQAAQAFADASAAGLADLDDAAMLQWLRRK
jgi:3-hydroxyisobutyrate dehydrogenase-like beta-hydroxyacid dehydrogenase